MSPVFFETPFGYSIDITFWFKLFSQPPFEIIQSLVVIVGWTLIAFVFIEMGTELWVMYRQGKYTKKWQWMLLAVNIPPLYIQTPKAVEQVFAHLSGAKTGPNLWEKFWLGKKQKWFSIEIVSIDGYIQFLIRCESEFRDLVEAAIYAQYVEAEITEVEDYVDAISGNFPDKDYNVFGVEFGLGENQAYPIRTYPSFEYNISKDLVFSDPMAAILENFSRIGKGENLWFQIILEPTGNGWKKEGIELVKEIVTGKKKYKKDRTLLYFFNSVPRKVLLELRNIWYWQFEPDELGSSEEVEVPGKVSELTPGVKATVEAVEDKIAKIGFKTKIRILYVARHEAYNPGRCIDGFIGSLNQFHIQSRNSIVPTKTTEAFYWFKTRHLDYIKRKFVTAFKKRKLKVGGSPYILNIEELATLWHFPLPFVKTPLLQKAETKRGEPPMNLPLELSEQHIRLKRVGPPESAVEPEPDVPKELPYA